MLNVFGFSRRAENVLHRALAFVLRPVLAKCADSALLFSHGGFDLPADLSQARVVANSKPFELQGCKLRDFGKNVLNVAF